MLRRRLIGLGVLVAVIAGAWIGITKPDPFRHRETVNVMFDHVQSIALVQRDVRVAGVNVGTIGTVRRRGDHAEVQLLLDHHIPIYRDARAALRPHTPFEGTAFVDLFPGHKEAGPLGDAPIPLAHTSVFVSAGTVLSTFTAPVRHGFQVIVRELSIALRRRGQTGLRTAIANAPALLKDTSIVAPALRGPHATELRSLIPETAATADALAGQNGELRAVVHDAARTLDAVAVDDARPFGHSLSELPTTLTQLTHASGQVTRVIDQARGTARQLIATLHQVPPTTRPLTGLLTRANPTLRALPPVISTFAVTLTRLGEQSPALGRLLATFEPIAKLLRYSLIGDLDKPGRLGLPTYLQLMASTTGFTGTLSSFVTARQSPLATGHALRGYVQGPETLPLGLLNSPIPCSAIAALNKGAVTLAQSLGLCTP
jgi:phospholipid/cholesterol/gamma-HCH transport system substrate-binding protein